MSPWNETALVTTFGPARRIGMREATVSKFDSRRAIDRGKSIRYKRPFRLQHFHQHHAQPQLLLLHRLALRPNLRCLATGFLCGRGLDRSSGTIGQHRFR
jgi:hypothetical protein